MDPKLTTDNRTFELKRLRDFYEKERDTLYDQVANLQGQKERLDWAIKVINAQMLQIEKEEALKFSQYKQQQQALQVAKEQGNVGVHPSERKTKLSERKAQVKSEENKE
jgi:hypothetical protein